MGPDHKNDESEATIRDLRASLSGDAEESTLADKLRELRARERKPMHPLAIYLKERGVKLAEAAELLGLTARQLDDVLHKWARPKRAELIAKLLGYRHVDDLFPACPKL